MSTIANAKVAHNYNRYNGYFFGCLHLSATPIFFECGRCGRRFQNICHASQLNYRQLGYLLQMLQMILFL